jgi:hypothetical protein
MSDDLRARLVAAARGGEILRVVYRRGSQPGTVREIGPLTIREDEVVATDIAADIDKTFKLAFLEVVDEGTSAKPYDATAPPPIAATQTVQAAVAPHIAALESLGWTVESMEHKVSLSRWYMFWKNGKPRRGYMVTVGFEAFTVNSFDDGDGQGLQTVSRPSRRPYHVASTSLQTRTFGHLPAAMALFLREARKLAADPATK